MRRRSLLVGALALTVSTPVAASSYRQIYSRPAADVYAALVRALPGLGYRIRSTNDDLRRVLFSSGMSAWSMGETMTAAVVEEGPVKSALEVDGELKMASNLLAKGRVMKHFDRIATAVNEALKATPPA